MKPFTKFVVSPTGILVLALLGMYAWYQQGKKDASQNGI